MWFVNFHFFIVISDISISVSFLASFKKLFCFLVGVAFVWDCEWSDSLVHKHGINATTDYMHVHSLFLGAERGTTDG